EATALALLALALLLAAGGGGALWLWRQAEEARADAEDERERAETLRREAEEALGRAEEAERKANQSLGGEREAERGEMKAREEVARVAYIDRVALAQREWDLGRMAQARRLLGECEERFRSNWEWQHFDRVVNPEWAVLRGHVAWVYALAYSPDGS